MNTKASAPHFDDLPASIMYLEVDERKGFRVVSANQACLKTFVRKIDEMIALNLNEFIDVRRRIDLNKSLKKVLTTGLQAKVNIHLMSTKIPLSCMVFRANEKQLCLIFSDVTDTNCDNDTKVEEQKEINQELSRLALIGETSASISHEIRNPLFIINTQSCLLKKKLTRPEFELDSILCGITKIEQASNRINKIIESILKLTQKSKPVNIGYGNIGSILGDIIPFFKDRCIENDVELIVETLITDDFHFECVPTQITQVLTNFIKNSFESITSNAKGPKWVKVTVEVVQNRILFSVLDSGEELNQEVLNRIGDKLFSTKSSEGHGLGLFISKKIAHYHNGKIEVFNKNSHPCFCLSLPLKVSASSRSAS